MNKLNAGEPPVIYGTDYPTPDGTCIRDYVDVRDIARAHLAAANAERELPLAINVGSGRGGSVRQIIDLVGNCLGKGEIEPIEKARRKGDSASLCADVSLIKNAIGFQAEQTLNSSIESLFQD
jgi:UDP-glucose 4-epimerase